MIDNQEGRRNLTDGWKFQLAQVERELLLAIGKEARDARLKQNTDLSNNDKTEAPEKPHNTREVIAADLGWSSGKTAQAERRLGVLIQHQADSLTKLPVPSRNR